MARNGTEARIDSLRSHLKAENPDLVPMVDAYRKMDVILRKLHLIGPDDTLTARIGWWSVVALVGLFSSGKSTLINDFLVQPVQRTGNQAVDDKFTVLCHGSELRELPGTALDADARFPFHAMGDEIEAIAPGEGKMVDRFLALKTVPSDALRGMIMVDSPGFDSDEYRAATLRLSAHILDLSDLVLVVFDARKPEPGVMRDTLAKLVAKVKDRADSNKFLFVLNQIDATSREDNLEEVVAAWQRALAGVGITGGRFYTVFSETAAANTPVTDRLRSISARDMADIRRRVREVPSVRGYRVAGAIEAIFKDLRDSVVPELTTALARWKQLTNRATLVAAVLAAILALVGLGLLLGDPAPPFTLADPWPWVILAFLALGVTLLRGAAAKFFRKRIAKRLTETFGTFELNVRQAFVASTRFPAFLRTQPVGWGSGTERKLQTLRDEVATEIRRLNDRFASPGAGGSNGAKSKAPLVPTPAATVSPPAEPAQEVVAPAVIRDEEPRRSVG